MEFQDPPPEMRGERSVKWRNIVASLKEQPGKWAYVGTFSPGVATQIRNGKYVAFLDGNDGDQYQRESYMNAHWEVTTRKAEGEDGSRRCGIWIRRIG